MDTKKLEETARETWDILKALLELHPAIEAELAGHNLSCTAMPGDDRDGWPTAILSGLEIAKYQSMNAASEALGITIAEVRLILCTAREVDGEGFGYWIGLNPERFAKVFSRFGLGSWPSLRSSVKDSLSSPYRICALLPILVADPEIAQLLANRFDELAGEVSQLAGEVRELNGGVSFWKNQAVKSRGNGRQGCSLDALAMELNYHR